MCDPLWYANREREVSHVGNLKLPYGRPPRPSQFERSDGRRMAQGDQIAGDDQGMWRIASPLSSGPLSKARTLVQSGSMGSMSSATIERNQTALSRCGLDFEASTQPNIFMINVSPLG